MLSRKIFISFVYYLFMLSSGFPAETNKAPRECVEEYENRYTTLKRNLTDADITEEYACYMSCVFKKWSHVDDNGDTNLDRLTIHDLNEFDLEQIDLCAKKYASEEMCLRVYKTQRCVDEYFKMDV